MIYTSQYILEHPEILINTRGNIQVICDNCGKIFEKYVTLITRNLKRGSEHLFCSNQCVGSYNTIRGSQLVSCLNCGKQFHKINSEIKKTSKNYCSHSCACSFQNKHKITGTRRSKLEIWIEDQLKTLYPDLIILYNNINTISSELDIYIPTLSLAFELNGIYHYEPIYGSKKLASIQNNDARKFQACIEKNIELCIIDSSQLKYFKPAKAKKYLDIITTIISNKLLVAGEEIESS